MQSINHATHLEHRVVLAISLRANGPRRYIRQDSKLPMAKLLLRAGIAQLHGDPYSPLLATPHHAKAY